jgi:hypothetical protein
MIKLRGAALAVLLAGVVVSVVAAQGWQATVNRQRDERLDRSLDLGERYPRIPFSSPLGADARGQPERPGHPRAGP